MEFERSTRRKTPCRWRVSFGTLNPTDGGNSERYSLQAEWHRQDENSETKIMAYGFYYDLDLFSDFTYYLTDTNRGDQFEQQDRRWVGGLDARHTIFSQWFGRDVENSFGLQVRNDWINNGLYQTEDRVRVDKLDSATGTMFARHHGSGSFYGHGSRLFMRKTKSNGRKNSARSLALRGDLDYFDVTSLVTPANSGTSANVAAQPEVEFDFRPVGKRRSSMRRVDSVFTATTGAAQRKRWSRSRRTIPIPTRRSREFPA